MRLVFLLLVQTLVLVIQTQTVSKKYNFFCFEHIFSVILTRHDLDRQAHQLNLQMTLVSPSTAPGALVSENWVHTLGHDHHEQRALGHINS